MFAGFLSLATMYLVDKKERRLLFFPLEDIHTPGTLIVYTYVAIDV